MSTDVLGGQLPSANYAAHARGAALRNILLCLWRMRGVNEILHTVVRYAPAPVRQRLEQERERVRTEELRLRVLNRSRLVPEQELRVLLSRGLRALTSARGRAPLGDYLEFGVYNGTSLTCMYRELSAAGLHHVRLFGFDSFAGFPPTAADEDHGRWQPGRCHSPLEFATAVLTAENVDLARVRLIPGWFADTLNDATIHEHAITKAAVIMIDCDLYSSTKQALDFCAPLIVDQALVIFDEWNVTRFPDRVLGEKKAFYEFLDEQQCFSVMPFGRYAQRSQAFMVTRTW